MNKDIIGYHGTNKKAADSIIKNQIFNKSTKKNEWLGEGVYFYELLEKAQWWSEKKHSPTIIEATISVSEDKLLNLDKPSEEDKLAEFIKFIDKSEKQFIFSSDKTERRCQIITMYMQYIDYNVVIGTFVSTNKKYKNELDEIGYIRTERQICVHDTSCIVYNNLRVVVEEE